MVKKLFKYEIIAYTRSMFPFAILMLCTSILTRIIQIFETDSSVYTTIFNSSVTMYVISIILVTIMMFITAITRFYKNLFTAEGYLSFTLPVTGYQHITVKLLTTLLFELITSLMIILSLGIATAGELLYEIIKSGTYLFERAVENTGLDFIIIVIEFVFLVLFAQISSILLFYACITIGQLAKKNRVLAAFGVYFGYYFITQTVATLFLAFFTVNDNFIKFLDSLFANYSEIQIIQIVLLAAIIFNLIAGVVYFIISNTIIKKKLNLE